MAPRDLTSIMENQMEKNIETGRMQGFGVEG